MSERMWDARVHAGTEGDHPLVTDAETEPDAVFSAMADEHRRRVLVVISGESSPMDVSTVVERIAARLTTTDSEPPSEVETRRLRSPLHHRRLPKTASARLVAYDTENRTIEPTQTTQL